jgi:predicted nuclease of predicted toxin-antitoxin system
VKFVVDMNLSPKWVARLRASDHEAIHWSAVGTASAGDSEIAAWARAKGHIVLTADLDFGSILAVSGSNGPSVVLLRSPILRPAIIGDAVIQAIATASRDLLAGALMIFDGTRSRLRMLPLRPSRQD